MRIRVELLLSGCICPRAISLGDELGAFITYDLRLADAARGAGLTVLAPA